MLNHLFAAIFGSIIFLFAIIAPAVAVQANDLDKAEALNAEALKLYDQGQYADAVPKAEEALAIREEIRGRDHPDVAVSLTNLAMLYEAMGDYARAEPLYSRALQIREKALGPETGEVALALNNLAGLCQITGDYARAESLYQRALAIEEKINGPDSLKVAAAVSNMGLLYKKLGDYDKAEPLYRRALAIWEKTLGPEHRNTAVGLNNLAVLFEAKGDYAQAEPLYKKALAIKEKILGPDHPSTATAYFNLGGFYRELGDYERAEKLMKTALAKREKTLGPEHPQVGASLNNLAELYQARHDYDQAEPLYKKALIIAEKALGPEHPLVAVTQGNLAELYMSQKDYALAEPLFKRALAVQEKTLGSDHPDVAVSLNNLAGLYLTLGDYERAEPLYEKAVAVKEKKYGPNHPSLALGLVNLAVLRAARGQAKEALDLLKRVQEIDGNLIDQVMGFTSEEQKIKFLATKNREPQTFLSLVIQFLPDDSSAKRDALNVWLRRKGVILEAQRRFQEALMYGGDARAVQIFQELTGIRARISRLTLAGPGKEGPESHRQTLAQLKEEKERLEAELSKLSRTFARQKKMERVDARKIAQILPKESILLEFARINMFNFKPEKSESFWGAGRYLVFIMAAGQGDQVELVDLGSAHAIDQAVSEYKKHVTDVKDPEGKGAVEAAQKLYELVFKPLEKGLNGHKNIFVSPDGNLSLIPFEVFQDPEGRFLIDDYTFNYLSAGRDLLDLDQPSNGSGQALLIGDPDFNLDSDEKESVLRNLGLDPEAVNTRGQRAEDLKGIVFGPLPGTLAEVKAIQDILGPDRSEVYTKDRAIEEILLSLETPPQILHLATHGFFLSDLDFQTLTDPQDSSKLLKNGPATNPLLRSGLALAGANKAVESADANDSDGLLTAEKVLGLKLGETDLVVLSACETGLGEIQNGEGVYGLRRAFIQAGAKSMIMSMWSVPDRETRELMTALYENMTTGGLNRVQALRKAALAQRDIVQKRYGHSNPLFWGAFIFLGQP